jgi:hypothetical protein
LDLTSRAWHEWTAKWAAPAVLTAGIVALLAAALHPLPDRGSFEFGLLYTLTRYEQSLPLAGLGLALAQMRLRPLLLNGALFIAAVPLGGLAANAIVAALATGADLFVYLRLLPAACSATTGLVLVVPGPMRAFLLPVAASASGITLGLLINMSDPTVEESAFALGAIACGIWLVAAPLLLWRRFARPAFLIAGRIFGSWLIAVGLMLGALHLIPQREIPQPPAEEPSQNGPMGRDFPEIEPPRRNPLGLPDQVY